MTALVEKRITLRLDWRDTPEGLGRRVLGDGGMITPYDDKILVVGWYYNGPGEPSWYGAIYEQLDDGPLDPESDLGLVSISGPFFKDEGHALEWAIKTIAQEQEGRA